MFAEVYREFNIRNKFNMAIVYYFDESNTVIRNDEEFNIVFFYLNKISTK